MRRRVARIVVVVVVVVAAAGCLLSMSRYFEGIDKNAQSFAAQSLAVGDGKQTTNRRTIGMNDSADMENAKNVLKSVLKKGL